jgi:hypothetical protein
MKLNKLNTEMHKYSDKIENQEKQIEFLEDKIYRQTLELTSLSKLQRSPTLKQPPHAQQHSQQHQSPSTQQNSSRKPSEKHPSSTNLTHHTALLSQPIPIPIITSPAPSPNTNTASPPPFTFLRLSTITTSATSLLPPTNLSPQLKRRSIHKKTSDKSFIYKNMINNNNKSSLSPAIENIISNIMTLQGRNPKNFLTFWHRHEGKFPSIFYDQKGRAQVLDYNQNKIVEALNDDRFFLLKIMLDNGEFFREITNNLDDCELEDILYTCKSVFHDLRLVLELLDRFRKMLSKTQDIQPGLRMGDAIQKISVIVCSVLECEKAFVFSVNLFSFFMFFSLMNPLLNFGPKRIRILT